VEAANCTDPGGEGKGLKQQFHPLIITQNPKLMSGRSMSICRPPSLSSSFLFSQQK
jgi:hypothetical protein